MNKTELTIEDIKNLVRYERTIKTFEIRATPQDCKMITSLLTYRGAIVYDGHLYFLKDRTDVYRLGLRILHDSLVGQMKRNPDTSAQESADKEVQG